jgi:hypothetical protein
MAELNSFKDATDQSVKDTRMEAREAALRFIYFYEQYSPSTPVGEYLGDMENTLNNFIDELNIRETENLKKYIALYDNSLSIAYHLFGKNCFRKLLPDTVTGRRTPVNKLLMLTLSVLLSKYEAGKIIELNEKNSLLEPLAHFIQSEDSLFDVMTYGTNGKSNIETGFISLRKFLNEKLIVA